MVAAHKSCAPIPRQINRARCCRTKPPAGGVADIQYRALGIPRQGDLLGLALLGRKAELAGPLGLERGYRRPPCARRGPPARAGVCDYPGDGGEIGDLS